VRQAHLTDLHETASNLKAQFKNIRISWVPREMNAEADRLVKDALGALEPESDSQTFDPLGS
jgi:ribonuclease HI